MKQTYSNYTEEYITLPSRFDATPLSVWLITPAPQLPLKGVIQIIHGMKEYQERYKTFMLTFVAQGYAIISHDCRGHGKSIRSKKDYGYFYGGGIEAYLEDIAAVHELAMDHFPDTPMILFGHSMGSLGARVFLRNYDQDFSAFILSGSPSRRMGVSFGIHFARLQKKLFGSRHKGRFLELMAFSPFVLPFRNERNPFAWVCSVPEVTKEYIENPLCGFTFTVDALLVLFELQQKTYTLPITPCKNPDLPILFLGEEQDPCINGRKKFKEAMSFMRQTGYHNVKGKLYKGMRHEICNEKNCNLVSHDIAVFLKRTLS